MSNVVTNNINPRSGDSISINGSVSIGGTLTYEDVTNIDSVGIITAQSGIELTGGVLSVPDGSESTPSIQFNGSGTDTGFYSPAADEIAITEGGSEALRIDSSGRLLVGTSSVTNTNPKFVVQGRGVAGAQPAQVHLRRSEGAASITSGEDVGFIVFTDNADNQFAFIACSADADAGSGDYPGRLTFFTTADGASSPTERMRISQNGLLNIGGSGTSIAGASHSFYAVGTTSSDYAGAFKQSGTGAAGRVLWLQLDQTSNGSALIIYAVNSTGVCFQVAGDGDVTNTNNSYGAISDIKLKENIVDASSQWNDLKALQVRNYNLKQGQTHTQIGLIAQEVEIVSPGLVSESPDLDKDGNDLGTVTKRVKYSVLYMKAVKALQEAMERIETLETKVAALEAQ